MKLLFILDPLDALKVYKDYADDLQNRQDKTNLKVLIEDFNELEAAGITHPNIAKVKKALQKQ